MQVVFDPSDKWEAALIRKAHRLGIEYATIFESAKVAMAEAELKIEEEQLDVREPEPESA